MTDHYAVFGDPIKHSKSPRIHSLFAQQSQQDLDYVAQQVPAETFVTVANDFFANGGKGLNCTVPLKELAWQYADQLTERARLAKAVNTLAKQADGSILGDNTDGIGLVNDLIRNHQIQLAGKRILILGAGGAARGIILPLLDCQPAQISIANRTVSKAEALVADFAAQGRLTALGFEALAGQQFDLVLNATSASLSDQLPPLPADLLAANACCYDLAYGNLPTTFVKWALAHGAAQSLDGLGMLVEQAAEAFFIWRGVRPATTEMEAIVEKKMARYLFGIDLDEE
jgi:shikimate dehydrogenase